MSFIVPLYFSRVTRVCIVLAPPITQRKTGKTIDVYIYRDRCKNTNRETMLPHIFPLMQTSMVYVFFTKKNNDLGKMRRYSWNILQWNKNKTKSTRMTQWRLLPQTQYVLERSLNHHDLLRTYLNVHGPRINALQYMVSKYDFFFSALNGPPSKPGQFVSKCKRMVAYQWNSKSRDFSFLFLETKTYYTTSFSGREEKIYLRGKSGKSTYSP